MLTIFSDAYMSRSGDFSDDNEDNGQIKPIALPLAHACVVITDNLDL